MCIESKGVLIRRFIWVCVLLLGGACSQSRVSPPQKVRSASEIGCEYEVGAPTAEVPNRGFFEYQYRDYEAPPKGEFTYMDTVIGALWRIPSNASHMRVIVVNKSSKPIRVNWKAAVYVSPDGDTYEVDTRQLRSSDEERGRAGLVMPGEKNSVEIVPRGDLTYNGKSWEGGTFLPMSAQSRFGQGRLMLKKLAGKSFSMVVPVQHDGRVSRYHFSFPILRVVCPN